MRDTYPSQFTMIDQSFDVSRVAVGEKRFRNTLASPFYVAHSLGQNACLLRSF
jgi:hypothetical protein